MVWLALGWLTGVVFGACPTPNPNRTVCAVGGCTHTSIAAAVTAAVNNDVICVEPGTYTQQILINSAKRVRVEVNGAVIVNTGSGGEIIRVENGGDLELVGLDIVGNTSRRCVYVTGAGSSLLFDGVDMSQCRQTVDGAGIFLDAGTSAVITGSLLSGNGATGNNGGTIFSNSASSLDISSTTVENARGSTGAGLWINTTPTEIDDVDFTGNVGGNRGGSIYATNAPITLIGGTFSNGTSSADGGCVALEGSSSLSVTGTLFESCDAPGSGGAIYATSTGAITIDFGTFRSNTADSNSSLGGNGGGLYVSSTAAVTVRDTLFEINDADYGGGIYTTSASNVDVIRSTFCENDAANDGGGSYHSGLGSGSLLTNNLYQANTCGDDGGGLFAVNNTSVQVRNSVFIENNCSGNNHDGDGAYFDGGSTTLQGNVFAYQTTEGARKGGGGSVSSAYNSWYSNGTDVTGFSKGTGELSSDPLFYDYSSNGSCDEILVPDVGSPLVNTGPTDAAQNDLDGTRNDIGLYGGPNAEDIDLDNDTSTWPFDCDDQNPAARPGGTEITADGADGDCNGTESCYQDSDNDGYGSATVAQSPVLTCISPGFSPTSNDCAPADSARHPGATETVANGTDEDCDGTEACYRDLDNDNFGTATLVFDADMNCTDDSFQANVATDCNDNEPTAYPGASETPANGVDQNCDGLESCYQDIDNDDYGTTTLVTNASLTCTGANIASVSTDCADNAPNRYPGAQEIPANGIDEDCLSGDTCYTDTDGDTYGHPTATLVSADLDCADAGEAGNNTDCNPTNPAIHPLTVDIVANGIDEDCSGGDTCYRDFDGDGVAGTTYTVVSADLDCSDAGEYSTGTDCNDNDPNRYPGKAELVANGVDEDCDGVESCFDDDDGDSYGDVLQDSLDLDCTDPGETYRGSDCNDTNASINPSIAEVPANNSDQNCDGTELCYADFDSDGYGQTSTIQSAIISCSGSGVSSNTLDCNDGLGSAYPGATETIANGIDESCDGTELCYRDLDGDGYGTLATATNGDLDCEDATESWFSTDCDDNNLAISPSAIEITSDGVDQNCDNLEQCYRDLDGDTYGRNTTILSSALSCNGTGVANDNLDCNDNLSSFYPGAPETADDGQDQDCSGTDTVTCLRDQDQDTYGSATVVLASDGVCNIAQREADRDGDCDDSLSNIHPGATEIRLDGIDQDCDGADLVDCYLDNDNDGFGVSVIVPYSGDCVTAAQMADNAADCNDASNTVYPGAPDICNDGIDTDCSGLDDEDGDGLDFAEEQLYGTSDCLADTDADNADDAQELLAGTDPLLADSDTDSLLDGDEFGGLFPVDSDGDDIIDALDSDDDNDSVHTATEVLLSSLDWDSDGVANWLDNDDDNDTIPTIQEDPTATDFDGDTIANWLDPDDDNDGVLTSQEVPVAADPYSIDSDSDTILDGEEWGPGGPARNTDGDDLPDIVDNDDDGDNIETLLEGADDIDGDSLPNYLDPDSDGDTKPDSVEGSSNDTDLDGVPDWLDYNDSDGEAGDVDQDGLLTRDEFTLGTATDDPDTDSDGVPDGIEVGDVDSPLDTDGNGTFDVFDPDNDGDFVESRDETGVYCGDGAPSYTLGYNVFGLVVQCPDLSEPPALVFLDTDGDGTFDFNDLDDDDDGLLTEDEDTNNNGDWFDDDADGDTTPDFRDVRPEDGPLGDMDGDGLNNTIEIDQGSSPYSDDTDGDGILDGYELSDSDQDGTIDFLDEDDDNDGVPTAEESRLDSDGDGTADYLDDDSDGDGANDGDELGNDADCDGLDDRLDARMDNACADGAPSEGGSYVRKGCSCDSGSSPASLVLPLIALLAASRRRSAASRS